MQAHVNRSIQMRSLDNLAACYTTTTPSYDELVRCLFSGWEIGFNFMLSKMDVSEVLSFANSLDLKETAINRNSTLPFPVNSIVHLLNEYINKHPFEYSMYTNFVVTALISIHNGVEPDIWKTLIDYTTRGSFIHTALNELESSGISNKLLAHKFINFYENNQYDSYDVATYVAKSCQKLDRIAKSSPLYPKFVIDSIMDGPTQEINADIM
jgi:hypothetical protein